MVIQVKEKKERETETNGMNYKKGGSGECEEGMQAS